MHQAEELSQAEETSQAQDVSQPEETSQVEEVRQPEKVFPVEEVCQAEGFSQTEEASQEDEGSQRENKHQEKEGFQREAKPQEKEGSQRENKPQEKEDSQGEGEFQKQEESQEVEEPHREETLTLDIYQRRTEADRMSAFRKSQWFTRGWTLQELLAPHMVVFYDAAWEEIGTRRSLEKIISLITNIQCDFDMYRDASIAQKMSWAARRKTSRPEDIAYCLMGLFGVNMPVIYGEGNNAFLRLQLEVIGKSDDESIFAWNHRHVQGLLTTQTGLLAPSPAVFMHSVDVLQADLSSILRRPAYTMTNRGLRVEHMSVLVGRRGGLSAVWNCTRANESDAQYLITPLKVLRRTHAAGDVYGTLPGRGVEFVKWSNKIETLDKLVFVKQPLSFQFSDETPYKDDFRFSFDVSSAFDQGFRELPVRVTRRPTGRTQTGSAAKFAVLLKYRSGALDESEAIFAYQDVLCRDNFAIVVDIIDGKVGANIVLTQGDKFPATTKFNSLLPDHSYRGLASSYTPFDRRRFDRVSRVLDSGRCVSVALHRVHHKGKQCYLVKVTITPPNQVSRPDDEDRKHVITDELYAELLQTGYQPDEVNSQGSWDQVQRLRERKRRDEMERRNRETSSWKSTRKKI